MPASSVQISIQVDEKLFLKDPKTSELGKKIIKHSVLMIDKMGFESFTFKKLAQRIKTTEPSIYRYFESKHKLLLYLLSWYWNWMEYQLMLHTANIASPEERLRIAIKQLSLPLGKDESFEHIDEAALYNIVVAESSKAYLNKEVDKVNKEGLFLSYKRLCRKVAEIISEINPDYHFPTAIVSSVIESSHHQRFFAKHLPSLTEVLKENPDEITEFLMDMVFKTISKNLDL